jgi:hypothetical protein
LHHDLGERGAAAMIFIFLTEPARSTECLARFQRTLIPVRRCANGASLIH